MRPRLLPATMPGMDFPHIRRQFLRYHPLRSYPRPTLLERMARQRAPQHLRQVKWTPRGNISRRRLYSHPPRMMSFRYTRRGILTIGWRVVRAVEWPAIYRRLNHPHGGCRVRACPFRR